MKLDELIGFEWDEGNSDKNFLKHGVSDSECEKVFFTISRSSLPMTESERVKYAQKSTRFQKRG
ncbi:MAG: BrnT family toxin [Chloroflexota bacterium]